MSDPFLGEIRIFGFPFAPYEWAMCNGAALAVTQNTTLFSLIGATYGGDGRTTFRLPNLTGRMPGGAGRGPGLTLRELGSPFGVDSVSLDQSQIPAHNHVPLDYDGAIRSEVPTASSALSGADVTVLFATSTNPTVPMSPAALLPAGNGMPHENRSPMLALTQCIALAGIFPAFP